MAASQYTCIVCPVSCRITVEEQDGQLMISGNQCKRGLEHAKNEHTYPKRMITSTVKISGGVHPQLPVISDGEVPKERLIECLNVIYKTSTEASVKCGDIIIKDICGTGVNIIAARNMNVGKEAAK